MVLAQVSLYKIKELFSVIVDRWTVHLREEKRIENMIPFSFFRSIIIECFQSTAKRGI